MLKQLVNKAIADPGGRGYSPADIVGSNPAGGIDSFLLFIVVCCQVEVSATSWSLVQGSPADKSLCVI